MLAMCQPEVSCNPLFHEANSQLDTAYLGARESQPDKNLNFMGEEAYDSNENWSQTTPGIPVPGRPDMLEGNAVQAPDNQTLLLHKQNTESMSRNVAQGLNSDGVSLASEEEDDIRRPPEGAEVSGLQQEKSTAEEMIGKVNGKVASSPLEDNGYASSSLSIDSPDSGGASAWDVPVVAAEDQRSHSESKLTDADPGRTSPISETLFPALAEAFRNLQDKKKFKEQEKEKHHVHLVMYRRLALLRWIRSLQQKVVDQQNRLQESFDTILDNRKELIRCVQQGMVCAKNPTQAEL